MITQLNPPCSARYQQEGGNFCICSHRHLPLLRFLDRPLTVFLLATCLKHPVWHMMPGPLWYGPLNHTPWLTITAAVCQTWLQQSFSCGRREALLKRHDAKKTFFNTKYDVFSLKVYNTQTNWLKIAETKAFTAWHHLRAPGRCDLTLTHTALLGTLLQLSQSLALNQPLAAGGGCLFLSPPAYSSPVFYQIRAYWSPPALS